MQAQICVILIFLPFKFLEEQNLEDLTDVTKVEKKLNCLLPKPKRDITFIFPDLSYQLKIRFSSLFQDQIIILRSDYLYSVNIEFTILGLN